MPLPTPNLDDRHFQDIVDQAKSLIPRYTPEWTDHNVSDPGVTLIELFAWMTDLLLYRVNQVPDKMYVKFLEMIGVKLQPPRAASAPVTFYLAAPQPIPVTIPTETEVATVRTETSPATIFTTERDLTILPSRLLAALTRDSRQPESNSLSGHDLRQLGLPGRRISMFPAQPAPGDAFYIGLQDNHASHVLALLLGCDVAGGAGVDPTAPPLEWEVWQGGFARWAACELEHDGTGGFNWPGEVILHLPEMAAAEFGGIRAHWLRCRITPSAAGTGYRATPTLDRLAVESRGGTVIARHATTVRNEYLGRSDGAPGQLFQLLNTPLLSRNERTDYLVIEAPAGQNGNEQRWTEVTDFADSGPADQVYTLDPIDGAIEFGPSLVQPDGEVYNFGATPLKGSDIVMRRYQFGGGVTGNVPPGTLSVMKTSIPYVARVTNRRPATGGLNAQSLDDAKLRAPQVLRTRTRAVTADDFEHLSLQVPGVARAHCRAPGAQPGAAGEPRPGQVVVHILPAVDNPDGAIPADQLVLSAELRSAVTNQLDARRLIGSSLDVAPAQLLVISVSARVRVPDRSDPGLIADVERAAEAALYRYLNPYLGGPRGDGWPFGRDLLLSELFGLLQRVPEVEFVDDIQASLTDISGARPIVGRLPVPAGAVICSGRHQVAVG